MRTRLLVLALAATIVGSLAVPATAAETPSPSASPAASAAATPEPGTAAATPEATPSATPEATPSPATTGLGGEGGTVLETDDEGNTVLNQSGAQVGVEIGKLIQYETTATAIGANGLATATLAIPAGLVPVILRGRLTSVADNPGVVRIRVGSNSIEMDAETGGRFQIAVPADAINDRSVTVEVRNTLTLPEGECVFDTTTTETISDLVLGFVGRETPPDTIAGFFSPPVKQVTIVADADAIGEAEAVMEAAGAMARRYDANVDLRVLTSAEFADDRTALNPDPGPKRIVRLLFDDTEKTVVSIDNPGVPRMTITGPADQVSEAAAALESVGLGLAAVPEAADLTETETGGGTTVLTLADLGTPKPTMSGLGRLSYAVAVSQDRFGGPVQSIDVHLEGVHTPVPTNAAATASILWNDQLIWSQIVSDTDQFLADVTVEPSQITRDNVLTVRVDAVNDSGGCNGDTNATQGFQLDLDGIASTLTARPGQTLPEGFDRFPQAFSGDLRVAFGSGPVTSDLIKAGASMVISMQRAAINPLDVTCEEFDTFAAAAYPGMVIGATPEDAVTLNAPLRFEDLRVVDFELTRFTVEVEEPFAALEAYDVDGRNILLLGSTAPAAQSAPLMTRIAEEAQNGEFGWFGFKGTMIVAQSDGPLLSLSTATLVPQPSVVAQTRQLPAWWLIAIGAIVLLLIVRMIMLWRRRRQIKEVIEEHGVEEAADPGPPTA
jgi:hypothetical protein